MDPMKLNHLQGELFSISRKGKDLTRQDVANLTKALEELAGPPPAAPVAPSPPPAPPAPSAAPAPTS
jgi:hypothetical protein